MSTGTTHRPETLFTDADADFVVAPPPSARSECPEEDSVDELAEMADADARW